MPRKNNANFIILTIIAFLFILLVMLLVVTIVVNRKENYNQNDSLNTVASVSTENNKKLKTVQEVIEESGSTYISESGTINANIYVNFKYDLFDENGKNRKSFFYDIIEQIEDIENKTFYLKDEEKNIEIAAIYHPEKETYQVFINGVEDFFNTVDGDIYVELSKVTDLEYSALSINNQLIRKIGMNSSFYANTELASQDRVELDNGYYSYNDGVILAKLQSGKVLNIIFRDGYEESFANEIYVKTSLSDILEKYPEPSFGSIREGYLGYITQFAYIFFYENEVSVYPYERKENTYFDQYIKEYCETGNLEKLASEFITNWTSYSEKEYDLENNSFKITFPVRGIKIDITNNNSNGIILYNNYYLTDDIKDLIKAKKITLESNNDLVNITEKARHEAM